MPPLLAASYLYFSRFIALSLLPASNVKRQQIPKLERASNGFAEFKHGKCILRESAVFIAALALVL